MGILEWSMRKKAELDMERTRLGLDYGVGQERARLGILLYAALGLLSWGVVWHVRDPYTFTPVWVLVIALFAGVAGLAWALRIRRLASEEVAAFVR